MFGLDPITLALIGGAVGGLTNKKDPVTGAMLGAVGGGAGGLLGAPAAAGAAGGAAGGTGLTLGAAGQGLQAAGGTGLAAPATALAQGTVAPPSAMDSFLGLLKPAGEAASVAQKVGLLQQNDNKPGVQAPPFSMGSTQGPQGLNNLVSQKQQTEQQRMARDLEERMRRQEMIMRMGGGYGITR